MFYDISIISVVSQHQLQEIKESRKQIRHVTENVDLSGTSLTRDINTIIYNYVYVHNYVHIFSAIVAAYFLSHCGCLFSKPWGLIIIFLSHCG